MIKGREIFWKEDGKNLEQGQLPTTATSSLESEKDLRNFPQKNRLGEASTSSTSGNGFTQSNLIPHGATLTPWIYASTTDLQKWASALNSPAAKQLVTTSFQRCLMKELCQALNTPWTAPLPNRGQSNTCTCFGTNASADVLQINGAATVAEDDVTKQDKNYHIFPSRLNITLAV